ncbi:MAG: DUF5668 domain-containing protein [Dehalococcoidia bacterium]|nr:DUF5668 domain-containing protein [Dehalococcoidia bacterium]
MLVALFLVLVGVMWLMESLGIVSPDWTDSAWPVILTALGGRVIYSHTRFGRRDWRRMWR